jgi:hypothetical protein
MKTSHAQTNTNSLIDIQIEKYSKAINDFEDGTMDSYHFYISGALSALKNLKDAINTGETK